LSITRALVERRFPGPTYKAYNKLSPIVSVHQNFDSLGFPQDHPGRSKTDTYYINKNTVLRTHTSAHQADTFVAGEPDGFTITADVYRRDAIDRSHYPVFHQMEGARMWSRIEVPNGNIAQAVWEDIERMPEHNLKVEDDNPVFHDGNPLQTEHSAEECKAIAAHLKRSLEGVVVEVFGQAKKAAITVGEAKEDDEPLRVRWIEAYFPFTSPSWELEVFWQGDWLELLGCGVVKQSLPVNAGVYLFLLLYYY
jgi:phenylalanyl-tRNA synthetase alpha chain